MRVNRRQDDCLPDPGRRRSGFGGLVTAAALVAAAVSGRTLDAGLLAAFCCTWSSTSWPE
jgi:hypothetical protein